MIETTIPTINVADVMARVRATAADLRAREQQTAEAHALAASEVELRLEIAPPPAPHQPAPVDAQRERLLGLIKQAQASTAAPSWIPKPLRGFFRRQGGHNRLVLETLSAVAKTNAQLANRVQQLAAAEQVQHTWLADLFRALTSVAEFSRSRAPMEVTELVRRRVDTLARDYRGELDRTGEHLRNLQSEVERGFEQTRSEMRRQHEAAEARLATTEKGLAATGPHLVAFSEKLDALARDAEALGEHVRNMQIEVDRLGQRTAPIDTQIGRLDGQLAVMREELNRAGEHLRNLDVEIGRAMDAVGRDAFDRRVAGLEQRLTDDSSFLKAELAQQRAALGQLRSRDAGGTPAAHVPAAPDANGDSSLLDAFYISFEDRFRGARAEIAKRLEVYLPIIEDAGAGTAERAVLDVGCGRGEWLELLQANGKVARGIDINTAMLSQCRARGLDVAQADVLQHLRSLADESLGAVTGFHIIEHLPFEVVMNVLAETLRVLQPGGVAVFESPNCKNLVVGASTFNLDPTHRNPVFPESAEFMLQLQGFTRTELRYLSPAEGSPFKTDAPEGTYLHERFFGPQDFSVIGYKATR